MLSILAVLLAVPKDGEMKMPHWVNESIICANGLCDKKPMKYERISDIQPGIQWMDAGGYCGSWASQRAFLSIGAWVSQQQVRDHTHACGGHDEEILSCNIAEAWRNLKIDFDAFDYKGTPLPQTKAYFKWLKAHLAAGRVVAWMLMWNGQRYPIYGLQPPEGMYGHVEPVVGIQSNHPLNETTVYDDDVVVHYTDGGTNTVHRIVSSLPCQWAGPGQRANCGWHHCTCTCGPRSAPPQLVHGSASPVRLLTGGLVPRDLYPQTVWVTLGALVGRPRALHSRRTSAPRGRCQRTFTFSRGSRSRTHAVASNQRLSKARSRRPG